MKKTTVIALVQASLLSLTLGLAACSSTQDSTTPSSSASQESSTAVHYQEPLDLQAHRGGRGESTEESRLAFEKALKLGVTTLEMDIVLSKDGVPVVWHDPDVKAEKCRDTAPVQEGDPQFPYVGKDLHDLNFAQLQTLSCDQKLKDFPDAEVAQNNRMLQLKDVFELSAAHHSTVNFNIETKIEGDKPERSASPEEFVNTILAEVDRANVADRVTIQSFDWRSLPLVKQHNPKIRTAALYDETTWHSGSPWLGSIDYDKVNGDALEATAQLGADYVSPGYSVPYGQKAEDPDFSPVTTREYVEKAHQLGIKVLPWTVNDEATMRWMITEAGVDGIITDFPSKLRQVMKDLGMELPKPASA
ncbi:glycerophosphodiester phosphodiesterase [Corynebacterium sp. 3HC-13]|uniref:glycerophosphodiester phosphodiesterase family protein n=1 Tax=Corynebacterium poyangense TaxID=2684405 RepID=UPI001CCDAE71|nr:glycerophosphodiester phosphodiesterase family protein [Corynebacterium poyangense]MBZ8176352.1 glycerophosphodiester phosphodiesterase [Corynebacterium poyangense]